MNAIGDSPRLSDDEIESRVDELVRAGEHEAAVTAGLRHYGPAIFRYLVTISNDEDAASDIFSQFAEDVWRGIKAYKSQRRFRYWAYRIARNAFARYYRSPPKNRARRLRSGEIEHIAALPLKIPSLHTTAVEDRLSRIRSQLAPEERELLVLRVDREMSWVNIAEIMNLSPVALRKRFQRTKGKLREILIRERASRRAQ